VEALTGDLRLGATLDKGVSLARAERFYGRFSTHKVA
jgi:hypothetical protein